MDARLSVASILVAIASSAPFSAWATTASDPPRFQLVGEGTLLPDQPVQKSGNVQLKATLIGP
ncbi:MAG: hypothetical protein P4L92_14880 [Rudaea sp.]|nr:hypothetical protein [Rudaea sp.]